jgi:ABC-type ATPase with predicted acetyltransferase domain
MNSHMTPGPVRISAAVRRRQPARRFARRAAAVFGLGQGQRDVLYAGLEMEVKPGEILAIVGPSGAGKSVLLDRLRRKLPFAIELDAEMLATSDLPAIDAMSLGCDHPVSFSARLAALSRAGLAEASAMITPARYLSGGQLHRLALARALLRAGGTAAPATIIADEFAGTLDPPSAEVLAAMLARQIPQGDTALVVATHRWELLAHLAPSRVLVKPLGDSARWVHPPRLAARRRWRVQRGQLADYHQLARFHYRAGPPAANKRVYVIPAPRAHRRWGGPRLAAVAVVSPPVLQCRGRNLVSAGRYCRPPRIDAIARLNAEVECISRVVVHPIYRGLGLASKLVRYILRTSPMPLVESLAVMGRVHPFQERAGMSALIEPSVDYVYFHATTRGAHHE